MHSKAKDLTPHELIVHNIVSEWVRLLTGIALENVYRQSPLQISV